MGNVAAGEVVSDALMWIDAGEQTPDTYVAFRGRFALERDAEVELRTLGSGWYVVWLDGEYVEEGPARYPLRHPEYESRRIRLAAGGHVLAVQAHHLGVTTRMLVDMPPFVLCQVIVEGKEVPVQWKCSRLGGYHSQVRRINPQLGWIEWCDTRQLPDRWRMPGFDDAAWTPPVAAKTKIGPIRRADLAPVRHITHAVKAIAEGPLAETFGYELDDIPARFFLRDLARGDLPAQGVWRRYDLGRVRLARPRFVMDLPAGAIVEFAYCEALAQGRISPYITLSAGASCNLDHYVARGGEQEFFPLTPKGGRFAEVHVLADPNRVKFVREGFVERCYYDAPQGAFTCGDPLLDRIWLTGVETHRGCAEDALIDNPTRERGQWTGDVVSVGMDINAVAYSDLRLCRRGLVQSAYSAREDGLIAGLCPGGPAFLSTYALQWINACVHYWELTGDRALLEEMYPYAVRNLAVFEKLVGDDGLKDGAGWAFVDWGYVRSEGPTDVAVNLHFISARREFARWCTVLGRNDEAARHAKLAERIGSIIGDRLRGALADAKKGWPSIGYHVAVLALRLGLIGKKDEPDCVGFIKSHILDCFPNRADAPRLSAPDANNRRLITPYFAHYAFVPLIERGEMDFVLDQYRTCWGWALGGGRTTWIEVFDTRWSHCHQWAGCPTWQLSRYVLGLHTRFDLGMNHFVLSLIPGSLREGRGTLPMPDGGSIRVEWSRKDDGIHYTLVADRPVWLHLGDEAGKIEAVSGRYETVLPGAAGGKK
ncbi:MAG: hypothetical protein JXQ73_28780 [Phycisphaerae bacterium]|nr:hypothetical protein [Phycisphaerae bacterium]